MCCKDNATLKDLLMESLMKDQENTCGVFCNRSAAAKGKLIFLCFQMAAILLFIYMSMDYITANQIDSPFNYF